MRFEYNNWLVAASIGVAILASYTALTLAGHAATHERAASRIWIAAGAVAMGLGLWSMHFVGMLALTLPVSLAYDVPTALLSLAVAVVTSGYALTITSHGRPGLRRLGEGALVMGGGLSAVHYIGMAAIAIIPSIEYDPRLVGLSLLIAVTASFVALWLLFSLRESNSVGKRIAKVAAAVVMGLAVSGMHYTAMGGARFAPGSFCRGGVTFNNDWLAAIIGLCAFETLVTTLIMAVFDAHRRSQAQAEASRFEQSINALQAEILERHDLQLKLSRERELLRTMIDLIPAAIYAKDSKGQYIEANETAARGAGTDVRGLIGKTDYDFLPLELARRLAADEQAIMHTGKSLTDHEEWMPDPLHGTARTILTSKVPLRDSAGHITGVVGTDRDITHLKETERRAASAERLESLGQLSAGVAHEINTPVQYVSDSVYSAREGVSDLFAHIDQLTAASPNAPELAPDLVELRHELPLALERATDGLGRIAEIVASMKDFSHPDEDAMVPIDLNRAIASTLVVARSEYRYVAEVKMEFATLPQVICYGSQINQVILNLVVNAAHAVADVVKGTQRKGTITLRTFLDGEDAVVTVSDTGGGIPEALRDRVFEPFFTTKAVGRGTGQGLTMARNVIVRGHGGSLSFRTEAGKGTTFIVRLPILGNQGAGNAEAA